MGRSAGGGGGFSGGGFGGSSGGFSGGGRSSGGFSGGNRSGGRSAGSGGFGGFGGIPNGSGGSSGGHIGGFGGFHLPTILPIPMNMRGSGGSGGSGGGGRGSGGGAGCAGCLTAVVLAVILLVVLSMVGSCVVCAPSGASAPAVSSSSSNVTASTVERTKISTSNNGQEEGYYTDVDGDWIKNPGKLEAGLKQFFKDTGVQPYVYVLPNGQTTSTQELGQMAERLYGELFDDETHFLLVFCDNGQGGYNCGYCVGSEAKTVMDAEAIQILGDYLDRYYNDMSLSEEEIFSNAFAKTGERIMKVEQSPVPWIVGGVVVVVIAGVVVFLVKKRSDAKARELKHKETVLNTPLQKFGDTDVEDLAKKYEELSDTYDRIKK